MFRLVDRPLSFRQQASDWIYKMLFLWSREPIPNSRAGPWFAWFATAAVLWRCRRRITKAILAISPLKLIKRRTVAPINPKAVVSSKVTSGTAKPAGDTEHTTGVTENTTNGFQEKLCLILNTKHSTGIKTRVKRLCTGDGPHVTNSSCVQETQQVNYRVTRSGRVYGKYPNKVVFPKK
ncbi:uncharacterized protein LOC117182124 [Belonocnema kinseyi]|uniref:uncharacterized protein LOC117182124 n=1 Tax=Belonocnema kinseyi TaxID=2817044 RepID=UPI00143D858D|nr:uncharacterized protein LOC117182124 [Belonocnema kinseyi]